jgi:hypothetical protein
MNNAKDLLKMIFNILVLVAVTTIVLWLFSFFIPALNENRIKAKTESITLKATTTNGVKRSFFDQILPSPGSFGFPKFTQSTNKKAVPVKGPTVAPNYYNKKYTPETNWSVAPQ